MNRFCKLEEIFDVKRISCYLPLLSMLVILPYARGQAGVDIGLGFGTLHAKANSGGLDNASSANAFGSCTPGSGDTFCQSLPSLSGFFLGFGGDIMFKQKFGFGMEANIQPSRSDYGPLNYRETFYDFNGVYQPISQKRFALQLQGGVGGARTSFAINQSGCVGTAVCTNENEPIGNASHFQVHFGAGVNIFVTEHIFIRPQFDLHYVPGFTNQFGSNLVTGGSVWVGYNLGHSQ